MLFNPTWGEVTQEVTQPDYLSNTSLIAWLEKQPADGTYPYSDPCNCMLAQYFDAHGFGYAHVASYGKASDYARPNLVDDNACRLVYKDPYFTVKYNPIWDTVAREAKTFGEALRYMKAYQAQVQ